MEKNRTTLELTEYQPAQFVPETISVDLGEVLLHHYKSQIRVEFPTPKTDHQWQLTPQGWVGHIPLAPDFHLALKPKVEIGNLFEMLEYAYHLKTFKFLDGLIDSQSLEEFYERLAGVLAQRVLSRPA